MQQGIKEPFISSSMDGKEGWLEAAGVTGDVDHFPLS